MNALRFRQEFSRPSKTVQEIDEVKTVRFLLRLNYEGLPVKYGQDGCQGEKVDRSWSKMLQNWTVFHKTKSISYIYLHCEKQLK